MGYTITLDLYYFLQEECSMKLMVIDGNSIINRAFYGIRLLSAPDGTYTNALLGFLNIFSNFLEIKILLFHVFYCPK